MSPTDRAAALQDGSSPYEIALATVRTIAACADGYADEQAVIDDILGRQGHEAHGDPTSIARAQHSIFHHQLQTLSGFGKTRVRPESSADSRLRVGREFMRGLIAENAARDFPAIVQTALAAETSPRNAAPLPSATPRARPLGAVFDLDALREAVPACGSRPPEAVAPGDPPGHIEHARRQWLGVLIDELDGDFARVACYWDRSSETTLRAQVRAFGLTERLAAARARGRTRG